MGKSKEWEIAKAILKEDIRAGLVPLDEGEMGPEAVYNMPNRPLFRKVAYSNFRTNLKNLRASIALKRSFAVSDSDALQHDLQLRPLRTHNSRGVPRWDGSAAQQRMRNDIAVAQAQGRNPSINDINPDSAPEYACYDRAYIRGKIDQEKRRIGFYNYVGRKNAEKEAKKKAAREKAEESLT